MTHAERIERCEYLFDRFLDNLRLNPEQAEAYRERLNQHKAIILDNIEKGKV